MSDRKPMEHYQRIHDHRGFITVRRSNGDIERGWCLLRTDTAPYGIVIAHRPKPGSDVEWQNRRVELDELFELNPKLKPSARGGTL